MVGIPSEFRMKLLILDIFILVPGSYGSTKSPELIRIELHISLHAQKPKKWPPEGVSQFKYKIKVFIAD